MLSSNLLATLDWLIMSFKEQYNIVGWDLSVSSAQCGICSAADRSLTPEFCRSLLLRSSSLRFEVWQVRTEDSASQLFSERKQLLKLDIKNTRIKSNIMDSKYFHGAMRRF